ncbi:hypothetical protein [Desulfotomaculum nigrificans]|uniref:hypothetical protein n=1 Tax=Desulfotomaculum nigrificans TaxID=1565 RepID=UPI00048667E7|nr:hypothetical protein [Desulfotomaculum nigrificans]
MLRIFKYLFSMIVFTSLLLPLQNTHLLQAEAAYGASYYYSDGSFKWKTTDPDIIPAGLYGNTFTVVPGATYYYSDGSFKWKTTDPDIISANLYDYTFADRFNQIPIIQITKPSSNQIISSVSGHDTINCSVKIYDPDAGDNITALKYSVDSDLSINLATAFNVLNLNQTLPKLAVNTAPGDTFNFDIKPFTYYPSLTDGNHTIYIYTADDKGGVSKATITFRVDRTPPTIQGTFSQVVSKDNFIKLHFVGTDASGGPVLNLQCRDENNDVIPELSAIGVAQTITTLEKFLNSPQAEFGEGKLITGNITGTDSVGNSVTKQIKIKIDSSGTTTLNGL